MPGFLNLGSNSVDFPNYEKMTRASYLGMKEGYAHLSCLLSLF